MLSMSFQFINSHFSSAVLNDHSCCTTTSSARVRGTELNMLRTSTLLAGARWKVFEATSKKEPRSWVKDWFFDAAKIEK